MSYKSEERELSMDEELVQRQREQALMEEFIKNKGVTKLPPDERLAAYSGRSKYRPTANGRRIIQHVASICEEEVI